MLEYLFLPFDRLFSGAYWLCGGKRLEPGETGDLDPLAAMGAVLLLLWLSGLFYCLLYAPGLAALGELLSVPAAAGIDFWTLAARGALRVAVGVALISLMGIAAFGAMRFSRGRVMGRLRASSRPADGRDDPRRSDIRIHIPGDFDAARALFFFLDNSLLLLILLCGDTKLAFPTDLVALARDLAAGTLLAAALTPPFVSRACLYGVAIEPGISIALAGPLKTVVMNWEAIRRVKISNATATIEIEGESEDGGRQLVRVREPLAGSGVYNALADALRGKGEPR